VGDVDETALFVFRTSSVGYHSYPHKTTCYLSSKPLSQAHPAPAYVLAPFSSKTEVTPSLSISIKTSSVMSGYAPTLLLPPTLLKTRIAMDSPHATKASKAPIHLMLVITLE
jgi:hypothetical protein